MSSNYTCNFTTTASGASDIVVTFDTTDRTGRHLVASPLDAGAISGLGGSPATLTMANGGKFNTYSSWGGSASPYVLLTINKDTTYWVDSPTGAVTSESTPGVNKVNFVFEPIDVVFDTTNQMGQHLNGGAIFGLGGSPATLTMANSGKCNTYASWGRTASAFVSLVINKDTTYRVEPPNGTVNSISTPGVNKVNFVFVANTAPAANAGADQAVYVNNTVTLDGSGSSDADGDPLTYTWVFTSRPVSSAAILGGSTSANPTFVVDKAGAYVVSLVVNDGTVNSAADAVTITTLNSAPVANAGTGQSVYVGNTVTLDGSGSSDIDGDALAYNWTFSSKPAGSTATLSNAGGVNPTFTVDKAGTYQVSLTVFDGSVNSQPGVVVINTLNSPPVAIAGPDQTVFVTDTVTLNGSGSTDVDGNAMTYNWAFTAKPVNSVATLSDATAVNPTFTLDKAGVYALSLTVNDGTVNSQPDTIVVSTLNTAPMANAGADVSVTLVGTTVRLDGTQSYDVDGDTLSYQWAFISMPAGSMASLSGANTAQPGFVADKYGVYVAQLIVADAASQSQPDAAQVTFMNIKPVANAGTGQSVLAGNTVTLDGSGSSDANGDLLMYQWTLTTRHAGSLAVLSTPYTAVTTFIADVPGTYIAQLVVNDGTVNSDPATAQVVATSNVSAAVASVQNCINIVTSLSPVDFKNANMHKTMINKFNAVIASIESGNYKDALDQLKNDILGKTDGCAKSGKPDKNDWIVTCKAQGELYPAVLIAIAAIESLL